MNRVLIIDDDHQICLYLKELIEQMGHEFVMANTVSEGVFCARETAFDLILLDLGLPDGNGLDLMPELTKMPGRRGKGCCHQCQCAGYRRDRYR